MINFDVRHILRRTRSLSQERNPIKNIKSRYFVLLLLIIISVIGWSVGGSFMGETFLAINVTV